MFSTTELQTRSSENENEAFIEGYFVVYNRETELYPGVYEEIAPEAFAESLRGKDILLLDNHNYSAVLATISSDTLELRSDEQGLWGRAKIDLEDPIAKSAYRKIQTNKVKGCSFGFISQKEETRTREDGSVKFRVTKADLLEVTITAIPAYKDTEIAARQKDVETIKKQKLEQRKKALLERMKVNG